MKTINELSNKKNHILQFHRFPSGVNRDMRECYEYILNRSQRYQYIVFEYDKKYLITNFNTKYILTQEIISGDIINGKLVLGQNIYFLKGIKFQKVFEYVMFRN